MVTIPNNPSPNRREFLAKCGKYAIVTPPAISLMLTATQANATRAGSGFDGGHHGGWKGGPHKKSDNKKSDNHKGGRDYGGGRPG